MKKSLFVFLFVSVCHGLFAAYGDTYLFAGAGSYYGDNMNYSYAVYNSPRDLAINHLNGDLYIADTNNHVIRKIDKSTGVITALAGSGSAGYAEGTGAAASFSSPSNICFDPASGILYVSDTGNYRIRSINVSTGQTALVAGTGVQGLVDGDFSSARFGDPRAIAHDPAENCLYVAESSLNRIRKVDMTLNTVTVVAGSSISGYLEGTGTAIRFNVLGGLVMDSAAKKLYVSDYGNNRVRVIDTETYTSSLVAGSGVLGYAEGEGSLAAFRRPQSLRLSPSKRIIYVCDSVNHMVRAVDLDANSMTSRVAGSGTQGDLGGTSLAARFNTPYAAETDFGAGIMYVADTVNNKIKTVDFGSENYVSFFSGLGLYGGDGNTIPSATFNSPVDVCINTLTGMVYILDSINHVIRRVDESGVVSTIAGTGTAGYAEGPGLSAQFNAPRGICADPYEDKLYISDTGNNRIRVMDLVTNEVSLLAGDGSGSYAEGIGAAAKFFAPEGLDIDTTSKMLFIADTRNQRIRRINLNTMQSYLIAGSGTAGYTEGVGPTAYFNWPEGVAHDQYDGLFVADTNNNVIRRINLATGNTIRISGLGAPGYENIEPINSSFNRPRRLAYDALLFRLYVTDGNNYVIRGIPLYMGANVDTVAGNGTSGYAEGNGASAIFGSVKGMGFDMENQKIYMADGANNRIRIVDVFFPTPTASVTPTDTLTHTPTETPTIEGTITGTPTITQTLTATQTNTDTPYFSPTETVTVTSTHSITLTGTASMTVTETGTVSQTPTQSVTFTETLTFTITETRSATVTNTETFHITPSDTPTQTPTATAWISATDTPVFSPTASHTASETHVITATATESATAEITNTNTPSETPVISVTVSVTASATGSQTHTPTPTVYDTLQPTASATLTPSVTLTPVDYYGQLFVISDDRVHPNPSFGTFTLRFDVSSGYDSGEICIYTSGLRRIHKRELPAAAAGLKNETFALTGRLANGVYFYSVILKDSQGRTAKQAGEIIVIR